jgi:hypothetical protein
VDGERRELDLVSPPSRAGWRPARCGRRARRSVNTRSRGRAADCDSAVSGGNALYPQPAPWTSGFWTSPGYPAGPGRGQVLNTAYHAHPERFISEPPAPPDLPGTSWINLPQQKETSAQ